MGALLAYTPVALIAGGGVGHGIVFAAIMYLCQFTEDLGQMPLYLQQLIRLREISRRMSGEAAPPTAAPTREGNPA